MSNQVNNLEQALTILIKNGYPCLTSFVGSLITLKISVENGSQVMHLLTYLDGISYGIENGRFCIYFHLRTNSVMNTKIQSCAICIEATEVSTNLSLEYLNHFFDATFELITD